ncbi:MAG: (d)CMP kinase [Lachnospiraceae bacterium]|nr:(d)CMP kinase [Lachnospiraceae bacterium]
MSDQIISIAVDGPAGAGKSTIAKRLAKELSFVYVDTGAMYRAMAIHLMRKGIEALDVETVSARCKEAEISIRYENGEQQVLLDGENVNKLLRTQEVGDMASASSTNPDVRRKLVELQQELAKHVSVVMDGRDIGSVVLPNAQVKIFLTASTDVRAKRRYDELIEKGQKADLAAVKKEIEERDYRDTHREHSPLKQVEDAVLVDSTDLSIDEVTAIILDIVKEKTGITAA